MNDDDNDDDDDADNDSQLYTLSTVLQLLFIRHASLYKDSSVHLRRVQRPV